MYSRRKIVFAIDIIRSHLTVFPWKEETFSSSSGESCDGRRALVQNSETADWKWLSRRWSRQAEDNSGSHWQRRAFRPNSARFSNSSGFRDDKFGFRRRLSCFHRGRRHRAASSASLGAMKLWTGARCSAAKSCKRRRERSVIANITTVPADIRPP